MGKKKIIGLCLAVGLMVGVVGGSLAWFTDTDTAINNFSTQGSNNVDNNGIEIVEDWNASDAKDILPGTKVTKGVQVKNNATYDQLIRVKLTKVWKDENDNIITKIYVKDNKRVAEGTEGATELTLNNDYIKLGFGDNLGNDAGKWISSGDYYYYNGKVAKENQTNKLLETVTLSNEFGNVYKGLKFDVVVDAEGVQAANGAVGEVWSDAPDEIKKLGGVIKE